MKTSLLALAATATLLSLSVPATAADSAAGLDAKAPCESPAYPRASLVNEETGTVKLGFLIAVDGAIVESKIEKSSGHKNLDKAAHRALSSCKFKPAIKSGKAEQAWTTLEYVWKLE
jgi:protein TonB